MVTMIPFTGFPFLSQVNQFFCSSIQETTSEHPDLWPMAGGTWAGQLGHLLKGRMGPLRMVKSCKIMKDEEIFTS